MSWGIKVDAVIKDMVMYNMHIAFGVILFKFKGLNY